MTNASLPEWWRKYDREVVIPYFEKYFNSRRFKAKRWFIRFLGIWDKRNDGN